MLLRLEPLDLEQLEGEVDFEGEVDLEGEARLEPLDPMQHLQTAKPLVVLVGARLEGARLEAEIGPTFSSMEASRFCGGSRARRSTFRLPLHPIPISGEALNLRRSTFRLPGFEEPRVGVEKPSGRAAKRR